MDQEKNTPQKKSQADQRKYLRSPLIVLRVTLDDEEKTFFGYTKNISRSGFFIATVNPRDPGSTYQVEVPLPPPIDRSVRCRCQVVWKRPFRKDSSYEPGMGLKFLDLPEEIAQAIDAWIGAQNA
jgi:uncharacterized protein (TIGR02266 family)